MKRLLAVVDTWFSDAPGGMARVAADHAKVATEHGWQVTVVTTKLSAESPTVSDVEGIRLIRLAVPGSSRGFWRIRDFRRALDAAVGHEQWDLLHLHSAALGRAALRVVAPDTPLIATIHSPVTDEARSNWSYPSPDHLRLAFGLPVLKALERQVLSRAGVIHVLSEFTRQRLTRIHGSLTASVVPHWTTGTSVPILERSILRRQLGWSEASTVFFTVRGHKPRVGLEDLIEASSPILEAGQAHLVIAGQGPLTPLLEKQVRALGLDTRVSFPGRLDEDTLSMCYRAADLFVLPTRELECFGLVTIEALTAGLAVLGSDAGATPEILSPIAPEFIYPAGNVAALAKKLKQFVEGSITPPHARQLQDAVAQRYSLEAASPRFLRLLDQAQNQVS